MEDSVRGLDHALHNPDNETIINTINSTDFAVLEQAETEHSSDAYTALLLNVTLIACLLAAYYVKRFRIYYLPESALALLTGVVVGGGARLFTENLQLFEFVSQSLPAFERDMPSLKSTDAPEMQDNAKSTFSQLLVFVNNSHQRCFSSSCSLQLFLKLDILWTGKDFSTTLVPFHSTPCSEP